MDEEIIQRIIYIIFAIVFFVIFSSKKKQPQKKTAAPTTTSQQQSHKTPPPRTQQEIFAPVEQLETKKATSTINKKTDVLEEIVGDEVFEDETTVDRRVIKKHLNFDQNTAIVDEKPLVITSEDLKKAVILSDIIQPKYF